jgi:hypothetical protein
MTFLCNCMGRNFQGRSQNRERLIASSCLPFRPPMCLSVRMEQHGFHWTDFPNILWFSKKSRKFKHDYNLTSLTGTLFEDLRTFMIICRWIFLEWEKFQTKLKRKSKHSFYVQYSPPLIIVPLCEIMWKSMVQPYRSQMETEYSSSALNAG